MGAAGDRERDAAVLGGLVAGPALAVFGFVPSAKADKNLAVARKNLSKARVAASEMEVARAGNQGVTKLATSFTRAIRRLARVSNSHVTALMGVSGVVRYPPEFALV